MADEMQMKRAQGVFRTLCNIFEDRGWKYDKDEEKLKIDSGMKGEDLPIDFSLYVDADRQILSLISHLPFVTPEDKRIDVAIAVSAVNYKLLDGCFDYDVRSGHMLFRMTNSFMESTIGEDLLLYLVFCACKVIDDFNDKFLLLAKGTITMDQFLKSMN